MRNVTVSIDDHVYRRCRIRAAELDTSVSALVRDFLKCLVAKAVDAVDQETVAERRRRLLAEVFAELETKGGTFRAADNLSREELYDRDRARAEAAQSASKRSDNTSA